MCADNALAIQLDSPTHIYRPGDIVRGNLQLLLDRDSTIGRVSVRLSGHAKSKIVRSNGQSTSKFHGTVKLFESEKLLHNDHYTHKSGQMVWPFSMQIPDHSNSAVAAFNWKARDGFRATDSDSSSSPLPPTFRQVDRRSGKAWTAVVIYTIEAIVTEPEDSKLLRPETNRATRPIYVTLPAEATVDYHDPHLRRGSATQFTVRTQRLLPGDTQSLSITQKISSIFHSSKIPKFTFDVDVSYQSVLQISHQETIPFIVSASPRTDAASTTIQPDMLTFYRYPSLNVKHLKLSLETNTAVRCPSLLSDSCAGSTTEIVLIDCHFSDARIMMRSVAWDQKNRIEEDFPMAIDFGKECNTYLLRRRENVKALDVAPSFATYNISTRYYLSWTIDLECAGEKLVLRGRSPDEVKILESAGNMDGEALSEDALWTVERPDEDDSDGVFESSAQSHRDRGTLPVYSELPGSGSISIGSAPTLSTRKSG